MADDVINDAYYLQCKSFQTNEIIAKNWSKKTTENNLSLIQTYQKHIKSRNQIRNEENKKKTVQTENGTMKKTKIKVINGKHTKNYAVELQVKFL